MTQRGQEVDGVVYYDAVSSQGQAKSQAQSANQIQKKIDKIKNIQENNIVNGNPQTEKKLQVEKQQLANLVDKQVKAIDKKVEKLQTQLVQANVQNRQDKTKQLEKLQVQKTVLLLQEMVGQNLGDVSHDVVQPFVEPIKNLQEKHDALEKEKRKEKDPERRKKLEKEMERLKKEMVALYNELLKKIKSSGSWFSNLLKPKPKPVKPLKVQVFRKLQAVNQDLKKAQEQLQVYERRIVDPTDLMPNTSVQQQQINKKLTQLRNKVENLKQTKQDLQKEKLKDQKQLQSGIKKTLEPLTRSKFIMPSMPSRPKFSPEMLNSLNRLVSKFSRSVPDKPYTEKELLAKIRQQLQELKSMKQNLKNFSPEETEQIIKEQQKYQKEMADLISLITDKKQLIKRTRNIDYLDEMIVNLTTILNRFKKERQTVSVDSQIQNKQQQKTPLEQTLYLEAQEQQKTPSTISRKLYTIKQQQQEESQAQPLTQQQEARKKKQEQQKKKFQQLKKLKQNEKLTTEQITDIENAPSVQILRNLYKKMSRVHHPDKGGNVSAMKQLNTRYNQRLAEFTRD